MSETIRVGLVGYGFASKTFHAPLIEGVSGMSLTSVVSRDAEKVLQDWPDVVVLDEPQALFDDPDIDVVVIPTPNDTHFPLAKAALLAGKHVVVDKPFTLTLAEAQELDRLAKHCGRLLSVFHNRRWDSDFLTVKQLITEGHLGEVVYFESHFDRFRPQVRDRWREQPGIGSGIWFDLGPHLVDQALGLFGQPVAIEADMAMMRPDARATDYFHVVLIYPQRRVVLHGTVLAPAETPRYIVQGTRGGYIKYGLDPQETCLKEGESVMRPGWGHDERDGILTIAEGESLVSSPFPTMPGDYCAYYQGIRDALNGQGDNPVPAAQAIEVMRLIELGERSAERRGTIKLHE